MSRLINGPSNECPWMFPFTLVTSSRTYELSAAIRSDREHWLRIFKIIIEMNKVGLSTKDVNPLVFEQNQLNKVTLIPKTEEEEFESQKIKVMASMVIGEAILICDSDEDDEYLKVVLQY